MSTTEVWARFNAKTTNDKVNILMTALTYMQSYNRYSKTKVVALAMGFAFYE